MMHAYLKDMARRLVRYQINEGESEEAVLAAELNTLRLINELNIFAPKIMTKVLGYAPSSGGVVFPTLTAPVLSKDPDLIKHNEADIVLVPVRGFTSKKYYLTAAGGGFYDKYIKTHPNAITIGVATDSREVFFVPEAHDKQLDFIVTNTRIIEDV